MVNNQSDDRKLQDQAGDLPVMAPDGHFLYSIVFRDSFQDLPDEIQNVEASIKTSYSKILIVTDSNVAPHFLSKLEADLKVLQIPLNHIVLPAGEEYKNLDFIRLIYQKLIEEHYDRQSLLLALGGGVIGDMTGFAAATYLRGVDFIQIPTTLLSQVDSSVGGKTGVDFQSYKNMVGAFYMPRLVYMNDQVYSTLPQEQLISGLGEVVKYGFICDRAFLDQLSKLHDRILTREPEAIRTIVRASCAYKKAVVEQDPTEKGIRAILNFGHTIGHAIEKKMNFTLFHGDCVGLGMVASLYLSRQRNLISTAEEESGIRLIQSFGLPIKLSDRAVIPDHAARKEAAMPASAGSWPTPEEILDATHSDKKRAGSKIRFILLDGIGNAVIKTDVSDQEILQGIQKVLI